METAWTDTAMQTVEEYLEDCRQTRRIRRNTEIAYRTDLRKLITFANQNGCGSFEDMSALLLQDFVNTLWEEGESPRTIFRITCSVKSFFKYLFRHGMILLNYAEQMETPKISRKPPGVLSLEEISRLLDMPDPEKPDGLRDKALIELMYASGLKVSEVIGLRVGDIDLQISCCILPGRKTKNYSAERTGESTQKGTDRKSEHDDDRERQTDRFVPFGTRARSVLTKYLYAQRDRIAGSESPLFVNRSGGPMSRQSIWKIIRKYADLAGIEECSPEMLRSSLAAHLLEHGADPESVREILGLSDINAVRRYEFGGEGSRIRKVYGRSQKLNG